MRIIFKIRNKIVALFRRLTFRKYNLSDIILSPLKITPKYIELGENVYIGHHARIEGIDCYNKKKYSPIIKICDGVSVQQNLHLTCANKVVIGKNTAIAANVTITDIIHPYADIHVPIKHQNLEVLEVEIGENCNICNNSVILPGAHIGRHVTIGANSVVTQDIPDYSVAVGVPAKIIKKYDFQTNSWQKE